jgi:acyl-CoA synthetase (AMP-forming)/AMP-acid ligase II
VAEMVHGSYIKLVDRTKDLVKSGGEWISSVELENEIMAHPDVLEAAVIAIPDERWSERPCACVVRKEGSSLDADGVREHLKARVAKWWVPDRVEFIDEVPKTSVGKFDKKVLRAKFAQATGSEKEQPAEV